MKLVAPVALVAGVLVAVLAGSACQQERIGEQQLEVVRDTPQGKRKVADVTEIVRKSRSKGELVQRTYKLVDAPEDGVLLLATLDAQGFAEGASYRREGPKGKRYVELTWVPKEGPDRRRILFSRGDDETLALPDLPVVLTETAHRLSARPNQPVLLLDLENAVARSTRIDERGHLVPPPPAPAPKHDDAVTPAHTERAPFLESKTPAVATWCRAQALGDEALVAAHKLALATKPKLAPERAGGPPSAFMTVQGGGYDQGGAALVVACLRALGHPARVVTGTVGAGDAATERTWAQVHDGAAWRDVDPLAVTLAGALEDTAATPRTARVEGFPGPLTTGLLPR